MTLLHASHVQQVRGDELRRRAGEIRARCDGLPAQEIADRIRRELLNVLPLEAQRLARGWTRPELSRRIDALYESDGLAAPQLTPSVIIRWERGRIVPTDEHRNYLCRVYETRPDRLGFGVDYTPRSTTVDLPARVATYAVSPDGDKLHITVDLRELAVEMMRTHSRRPVVLQGDE